MAVQTKDLWGLVLDRLEVDPQELAEAVQEQASQEPLEFRTRLLIRDSLEALARFWGEDRLETWLANCPARRKMEAIRQEDLGRSGISLFKEASYGAHPA